MTLQRYHTITIIDTQYTFALRHEKHLYNLTHTMFEAINVVATSHAFQALRVLSGQGGILYFESRLHRWNVSTRAGRTWYKTRNQNLREDCLGVETETSVQETSVQNWCMIQYEGSLCITRDRLHIIYTWMQTYNICEALSNHGGSVWKQLQITSVYISNSKTAWKFTFHTTGTWHRRACPDIQKWVRDWGTLFAGANVWKLTEAIQKHTAWSCWRWNFFPTGIAIHKREENRRNILEYPRIHASCSGCLHFGHPNGPEWIMDCPIWGKQWEVRLVPQRSRTLCFRHVFISYPLDQWTIMTINVPPWFVFSGWSSLFLREASEVCKWNVFQVQMVASTHWHCSYTK